MKRLLILLLPAALLATGCSKRSGGGTKLRDEADSIAYILGMNIGTNLLRMDSTMRTEPLCEGIRDRFRGATKLTEAEAETFFLGYMNVRRPEKAHAIEEQFLADIAKSDRSFARASSGITYSVDAVGDQGELPVSDRDSVRMRYLIRSIDGTELYSSYERGDTTTLALGQMPRGVKESVKLVGPGGKIRVWIPSREAYGPEGEQKLGIAPNATLYYEIELVEVARFATRTRRNSR